MKRKKRSTLVRFDSSNPAMTLFRSRYWVKRVVYILRADKPQKYSKGRSRIIYIGESGRGIRRPTASAAAKANAAFGVLRGVKKIDVHLLTFRGKRSVRLWEELERGLLAAFQEKHDCLPCYNIQGKSFHVEDVKYFRLRRLRAVIERLAY